jgi:membrane protease YdiL (CAAX protease family)
MTEDNVDSTEPIARPVPGPTGGPPPAPRRSVFREIPWRWIDVLIGIAPAVLPRASSVLIDPQSLSAVPRWLWFPFTILAQGWMLAYPLWVMRRRNVELPSLPRPRTIFVEALIALLAAMASMVVVVLVTQLLIYVFGEKATPTMPLEPIARSPNQVERVGFLTLVFLVAPVVEELFFRGMLYNALRQRLHLVLAVPLQAIVFGLSHPFGLADMTGVTLLGLAFALVYEWRQTLLTPILMHFVVNVLGMAVMASGIADPPRLGVYGETHADGCLLTTVMPGSAAETAGLRVGDVVISLNGESVADMRSLTQAVRRKQVGQEVVVEFIREGKAQRVTAVLTKLRE